MGLAGPRKRTKISYDPNNVAWARSTDTIGHKILTAQGWTPGSYLGAKNAPHADLHSAASKSYIRVALKDDNLGLGAQSGGGTHAERATVGLDAFESILGRLSGKSEEQIQEKQEARAQVTRRTYIEQRFGTMTFVRGGMLERNKIQDLIDAETERLRALKSKRVLNGSNNGHSTTQEGKESTKRKKGKKASIMRTASEDQKGPEKSEKRLRKEERRKRRKDEPGPCAVEAITVPSKYKPKPIRCVDLVNPADHEDYDDDDDDMGIEGEKEDEASQEQDEEEQEEEVSDERAKEGEAAEEGKGEKETARRKRKAERRARKEARRIRKG